MVMKKMTDSDGHNDNNSDKINEKVTHQYIVHWSRNVSGNNLKYWDLV